jgi:hypothetical protein
MAYSTLAPNLALMQHVNEVPRTGVELVRRAIATDRACMRAGTTPFYRRQWR